MNMMTVFHPRWNEFLEKMQGPGGCNFKGEEGDSFKFTCDNTYNRPIARRILKGMGLTDTEIEQSMGYFVAGGGFCDCEIVFNVPNLDPRREKPIRKRKTKTNPGRRIV